jgi:hypothetical protein
VVRNINRRSVEGKSVGPPRFRGREQFFMGHLGGLIGARQWFQT